MRILQLIDSLDAGGAERMAVSYANALSTRISFSALIATRKEGVLKKTLNDKVAYRFINKNNNLDISALFRLKAFCVKNKITHIHAHGSSFFWAVLIKLLIPKIKIIWHDHLGSRVKASINFNRNLIHFSRFFDVVITVNQSLNNWAKSNLKVKTIIYLPNFAMYQSAAESTFLKGEKNRRIVILANLKKPKNHLFFVKAFCESGLSKRGWSLHLLGQDFDDDYSNIIKSYVKTSLVSNVYFYGQVIDVQSVLKQGSIGVLASTSEGFPVSILEYAEAGLVLFSTNVGECSAIIEEEMLLFDPYDLEECKRKLLFLINRIESNNIEIMFQIKKVNKRILLKYSEINILNDYLKTLRLIS